MDVGALSVFPSFRLSDFSRDVAQSGSAPEWGSGGRRFESGRPDLLSLDLTNTCRIGVFRLRRVGVRFGVRFSQLND